MVYRSGRPYRLLSLGDLVDGWYRHELAGPDTVVDE